jgi:hypothetical protein
VIPEPVYAEPLSSEPIGSSLIGFHLFRVLPAVQFNDQPTVQANEIGHERAERHLPAELVPAELAIPQPGPRECLSLCQVLAEFSGSVSAHGDFYPPP